MGKPEIRFKGYTDEWEQRKLDDVVEFLDTMRKPLEGAKRIPGPYPYYGASGIVDYVDGYLFDEELILLSEDGANITERNYPVCFLASGKYWVNNHAHVLRTKQANENNFICNSLERKDYTQYNTGMAMPKLNKETCKKIPILCPGFEEQKKVGDYFRSLDHLITLHQRKCDEVKSLKKYMLQKMFPQNEQKVPEIRFEGFTEAWEQRKFSEGVSEIGDGLHGTPIYCEDGNVYFINGNNLVDGKIVINAETKKVNESQQSTADKSLDDTTILMSINGTIGNLAYYSGERLMLGKSAAYIKVSEFDKRFVYAYLQAPSVHGYFMDSLTGTTIKNLGLKAIREMIMFIPQDVDEQKRIGKFLDQLDHLITLHQQKCEELKKIKKFMLQKMFV